MYAVQFAMILNIIHHHQVAMIHQVDKLLLWVCARFYMVFVENDEFRVSHEPTEKYPKNMFSSTKHNAEKKEKLSHHSHFGKV